MSWEKAAPWGPEMVIDPVRVRSAVTVQVSGDLDQEAVSAVVAAADQAMVAGLPTLAVLVLDLRTVTLVSASGIRPLTDLAQRCTANGVRCCVVVRPGSAVASVFASAGVGAVLPWFGDFEQALAGTATMEIPDGSVTGMADPEELSGQFEMLARALLGTTSVGAALQHVIDAAAAVIPAAAVVSVTLRTPDGEVYTPVQTDDAAADLDKVQYSTGLGPCLDAADPRGPAYAASHDLGTEGRWPEFAAASVAAGYRAVHSTEVLPGVGPDRPTGALNIYFHDAHALGDADRHTALLLATHAALALAHARSTELADLNDTRLHRAIDTRDVIGQAKGILMQRQGITADEAFALLRGASQDLNVKLVEISRNLVARHTELDT